MISHKYGERTVIGVRNLHPEQWWGEGEIKVYMDGDKAFPTICGTGSEDYVGLFWGVQLTPFLYNGCTLNQKDFVSMYRWHLADPIAWQRQCRITIQQIAYTKKGLVETQDDWSMRNIQVRAGAQRRCCRKCPTLRPGPPTFGWNRRRNNDRFTVAAVSC